MGQAKQVYPDGSLFEGWFIEDQKHQGRLIQSNSYVFEGQFEGDKYGNGKLFHSDGAVYQGGMACGGRCHNFGTFKWADGRFYNGQWREDQKKFTGQLVFPDGRVYNGKWKDGLPHGPG